MFFELYKKRISPVKKSCIVSKYTRLVPLDSLKSGVVTRSSCMQEFDNKSNMMQFNSCDFSIGNLIAVGAYKETPVILSNVSDMGVVDKFEQSITTFEKSMSDVEKS